MRRAKIVCTLGPATSSSEQILALVEAGMDIARLNLSHGDYPVHEGVYRAVREASDVTGRAVGDPRRPAGAEDPHRPVRQRSDQPRARRPVHHHRRRRARRPGAGRARPTRACPATCNAGDVLLIDDGKVSLRAVEVTATDVVTEAIEGGVISNNKGINLPGVAVSVPAMSEKDIDDLRWALRLGVDLIALSFVRSAADLDDVHKIMDEEGKRLPVIAKIEKPQAVDNLREIIDAFDGVMVARGDLGVELPLEDVPLVQKSAVEIARQMAKPVIVATQVLESMIENSRPTRAETSDCANAVLDGADAIMLSGETSVGAWPVQAVRTMARIIEATEDHGLERIHPLGTRPHTTGGAVTWAAVEVGELLGVKYLVTFTQSGDSAKRLSRLRSRLPMLAFTPIAATRSQLALVWGIETFIVPMARHTDQMALEVDKELLDSGRCEEGDRVIIVAGSPPGIPGSTNALRVHRIGDAKNKVAPAYEDFAVY